MTIAYRIDDTPLIVWWDKRLRHATLEPPTTRTVEIVEYLTSNRVAIERPVAAPGGFMLDHTGRVGKVKDAIDLAGAVYHIPPFVSVTPIPDLERFMRARARAGRPMRPE